MKTTKIFAVIVLLIICVIFAGSRNEVSNADLQREIDRLWAVTDIQNLMGTYSMWHTSGFNHRVPELFTTSDDTVVEMMWGRYTGKDAAYRCYAVDHRRDDQGAIDALHLSVAPVKAPAMPPGVPPGGAATGGGVSAMAPFHMHLLTTPVIQVAKDGQTARGVWTSPGIEGSGWGWMKYGADFKKENGQWKIWHLHVYGLFMASFDKGWADNPNKPPATTAGQSADKAPTTNWEYYKGAKYIPLEPEPPQPYSTWGDKMVPPTYGSSQ